MKILDNPEEIKNLDTQDMLGVEENFYSQLVEAGKISDCADIGKLKGKNFTGLAILGMGGSGFTGDIIKSLITACVNIPVEVVKSYELPCFIEKGWLVLAVSYSGNTEETIRAARDAIGRGCSMLAISSGGSVKKLAVQNNECYVNIPAGLQPRGASGYLFFTTFSLLGRLGIINLSRQDIDEALNLIKQKTLIYRREVGADKNPAKKLAVEIFGRLPVIYGVSGYLSAVAYRWKCEINENAKCPAFWAEFPELNHNETVGWQNLKEVTQNMILIVFKDDSSPDKIKTRINTTVKLIKDNFSDVVEINIEGTSELAKALSAMYLGDIASVYLALLYNTDPTPVDRISVLKAELAKLDN